METSTFCIVVLCQVMTVIPLQSSMLPSSSGLATVFFTTKSMKMEAAHYFKMSVPIYQTSWLNISENLNLLCWYLPTFYRGNTALHNVLTDMNTCTHNSISLITDTQQWLLPRWSEVKNSNHQHVWLSVSTVRYWSTTKSWNFMIGQHVT
jgi:hypothetical protein